MAANLSRDGGGSRWLRPTLATVAFWSCIGPGPAAATDVSARPSPAVDDATRPLLLESCGRCHGADDPESGFRVDTLPARIDSTEAAERWRKVLGVLNSGAMPPKGEPSIDAATKLELLDDLSRVLVAARKVLSDTDGRVTVRRLNRREYVNTVADLLGVVVEPRGLPADGSTGTFDTMAGGLFVTADQIEQYHELGRIAIQECWRRYGAAHAARTHRMEAEVATPGVRSRLSGRLEQRRQFVTWKNAVEAAAQRPENRQPAADIRGTRPGDAEALLHAWERIAGAPSPKEFGFTDSIHATQMGIRDWNLMVPHHAVYASHPAVETGAFLTAGDALVNPHLLFRVPSDWPPGEYLLRLRVAAADDAAPERRFIEHGLWGGGPPVGCRDITGTMRDPQIVEIPVTTEGGRVFFFREKGTHDSDEQSHRVFFDAFHANGIGPPLAIWVDWVEVEGPLPAGQRPPAAVAELVASGTVGAAAEAGLASEPDVRVVLERFARRAFRGVPPDAAFLDKLVAIYERNRAAGRPFRDAVTEPLAVVLSAPHFLYLAEPCESPGRRPLDGRELATRLSYFLWSGPPDDELLMLAETGGLHQAGTLETQVERMIADPRSRRFTTAFVQQWLGVERLDFFQFKDKLHPRYDLATKEASRREIFETFAFLLRENRSLRDLLRSDFVVIDPVMARFYGLEGVHGEAYRRVPLPEGSPRGGLLGMAAVLAMGSNGEQTSPVERGAWVLRKLLHDPPPPAPPNVPQIARLEGKPLTVRERLRAHQEEPQCASCHRTIDPIGLGLENFDAVGLWRTNDAAVKSGVAAPTREIDPSGGFHAGPAFRDFFELRGLVAARHADFATGFTEALLGYALGRTVGFVDEERIRTIVARASSKDDVIREFVQGVVESDAFQSR